MMTLIAVLHFAPHKWSFLSAVPHSFCGLVHISEMVFPEYGVHFIAVNDGVDSIKGDSEFTAIRNVFNEMFAKDTSKKIKATLPQIRPDIFSPLYIGRFPKKILPRQNF